MYYCDLLGRMQAYRVQEIEEAWFWPQTQTFDMFFFTYAESNNMNRYSQKMEESSTNSTVRVIIEGMSKRNLLETLLPTKVMTSLGNSKILVTIKDLKKKKNQGGNFHTISVQIFHLTCEISWWDLENDRIMEA